MTGGVKTVVKTNDLKGSVCRVDVKPVKFDTLWGAYPDGHPSQAKDANGELLYTNQCAIKVSVALHAAGVEMKSFTGAATLINGKRAALRAEELAAWLNKMPFCGLPPKGESVTGADWKAKVKDRTGIISFADYWARSGESDASGSGDHIDLWNKKTLTPSLQSTLRFRLGIGRIPNLFGSGNWYSNLDKSKNILFWEIK